MVRSCLDINQLGAPSSKRTASQSISSCTLVALSLARFYLANLFFMAWFYLANLFFMAYYNLANLFY